MEKTFFDQPIKNNWRTYNHIPKIVTAQGVSFTTSCLLDWNYFKDYYKMTTTDLNKQKALDGDPIVM